MSRIMWLSGHHVLHPKTNLYTYVLGGLDFVKPFLIWKCHFLLLSYFQLKAECVRLRLHSHCPACIVLASPTSQTLWDHRISPSRAGGRLVLPSPQHPTGPTLSSALRVPSVFLQQTVAGA